MVEGLKLPFYSSMLGVLGSPLSAVFVAVGARMLVGDGLGTEYLQDSSKALGMEGEQLVEVAFSHPPTF